MRPSATPSVSHLFARFPHDRGPVDGRRAVAVAELHEWPALWAADPRLWPLLGDAETEALVRSDPQRLRYFASVDPEWPSVPLLRTDTPVPRPVARAGIRDKLWQRLVVEEAGHLPQPDFAAVTGTRVEGLIASWPVDVAAVDCRSCRESLLSAAVPGAVIVVEDAGVGFTAVVGTDSVHLVSRSPHVRALRGGEWEPLLSFAEWAEFVSDLCVQPLALGVTKAAHNPAADLGDALLIAPGSYILKPRFGSNGFAVARVVSHPEGFLTVESDCPDTALYLEEFPCDPARRGRDLVEAVAAQRSRFINRATAGLPERTLDQSILEGEIRQDRAGGSLFEPRIVVQRVKSGPGERFVTLGACCKRIDTAVGASLARDFCEEPLEASLHRFLGERVPHTDLDAQTRRARDAILAAGDQLRAAIVPLIEVQGARVHQFGIDCRLCWNPLTREAEFPFLEFQFGIGRIDSAVLEAGRLAAYKTRSELTALFGPEVG